MDERRDRLDDLRIDTEDRADAKGGGRGWFVLLILLAVCAVAVLAWFLTEGERPSVRLGVVTARGGDAQDAVLNASGYVTARRKATVSSEVTGRVVEVLFEEGSRVAANQVLARLDDALVRARLDLAQASLEAAVEAVDETEVQLLDAARETRRARELIADGVIGQAELDRREATEEALAARLEYQRGQVEVARRQVDLEQTQLADMEIRAPFTGVAISKDAQPGEMVSPVSAGGGFTRTGICTLVDMTSLEIEVDVGEAYIGRVRDGQRIEAVLDAYPDWTIPAQVITTVPAADRERATVRVRIAFDELDPRILPDMGVRVAFLEDAAARPDRSSETLLVPRRAVQQEGEETFVFVWSGGRVERRAVRVGPVQGHARVVEAGLEAGERVVLEPPPELADGAEVGVTED